MNGLIKNKFELMTFNQYYHLTNFYKKAYEKFK
jgi:hypothetical protein